MNAFIRVVTFVAIAAMSSPSYCQEKAHKAGPRDAAVKDLLIESRKEFLADAQAKDDPRGLQYTNLREGISYSLLMHLAVMLAPMDANEAAVTAEAIDPAPVRAFAFTQVALAQAKEGQKQNAEQTLKKAVACIKSEDVKTSAQALWPHAAAVLLWIHGDLKAAEKAAGEMGCPWESLNTEERQFQLAHYYLAQGDPNKALQALRALPANTFKLRRGSEALRNDQGAGLYYWAQQPNSAWTAEHELLRWLEGSGKLEWMEQVINSMDDASQGKVAYLGELSGMYAAAGNKDKARELLKKAGSLADAEKNDTLREAAKTDLAIANARLNGKSVVEALKENGVLESSRGKPWQSEIIKQVFEAGDYELGLKLAEGAETNDMVRACVAVALIKAGKLDQALARVKQADGLLGPSRILLVIAALQSEDGNSAAALETLKDALGKARDVRSTNKWFPDKGEVTLQEKWDIMDRLFSAMVGIGCGKEALKQYQAYDGSIRRLAREMGARKDVKPVRDWIEGFADKKFGPAAKALALFGLAEGLEAAKDTPDAATQPHSTSAKTGS